MAGDNVEDKSENSKEGGSEEKQRPLIEDIMPPSNPALDSTKSSDAASPRSLTDMGGPMGDVLWPQEPTVLNPQGKLSEIEMNGTSKEIADRVAQGDKLGNEWSDINKALQRAAESGQLEDMVQRINDQLRRQGSDKVLSVNSRHGQSVALPEHSPFESWNNYTVTVTDRNHIEVDSTTFTANHRQHAGTALDGFPPRFPRLPRPLGLPNLDIKMD